MHQTRRLKLMNQFPETLFVIPSGREAPRSHSVNYRFKGPSDFFYLMGFHLRNSVLVLFNKNAYLLKPNLCALEKLWEGEDDPYKEGRLLDVVTLEFTSVNLSEVLESCLGQANRIGVPIGRSSEVDTLLLNLVGYTRGHRGYLSGSPLSICDSRTLIGSIRRIKEAHEIDNLRESAKRSSKIFKEILKAPLVGRPEEEVCNQIEAGFLNEGMRWLAYETIVGSGERTTILHARPTEKIIRSGELVLIDAGGEWEGYCSDITRTLPASKKFDKKQKEIYQIVLKAQKAAIDLVAPGRTLNEIHERASMELKEGLEKIGLPAKNLAEGSFDSLMPHKTSHWIGLDVHDPAPYLDAAGEPIKLGSGMTFTIEPGLYFRDRKNPDLKKYFGIGVRIEDDVLVTKDGCEVLSDVPKEVEEIES